MANVSGSAKYGFLFSDPGRIEKRNPYLALRTHSASVSSAITTNCDATT